MLCQLLVQLLRKPTGDRIDCLSVGSERGLHPARGGRGGGDRQPLRHVLQAGKTKSYNGGWRIIPRSWLRDWNPQPFSSSHMALSIMFTMAEPVTLRLRLPGMPPQPASVRGD